MFRQWSWSAKWARWASLVLLVGVVLGTGAWSRSPLDSPVGQNGLPVVSLVALPPQAQEVWGQIHRGGPFRYEKDGTVFFNRERLLPREKRGYYREYTVPTPGLKHRGARRIVCGGERPQAPEACYYTADHYSSFQKIVQ